MPTHNGAYQSHDGAPPMARVVTKADPERQPSYASSGYNAGYSGQSQKPGPPMQDDQQLMSGEEVFATFKTTADCTCGLPRYRLAMTNKRLLVKEKVRYLAGLFTSDTHLSIQYDDIVNVWVTEDTDKSWFLYALILFVFLLVAGAIMCFVVLPLGVVLIVGSFVAPPAMCAIAVVIDRISGGRNLVIDVCRKDRAIPTWSGHFKVAHRFFTFRLPPDEAMQAMHLILTHPRHGLMPRFGFPKVAETV